MKTPKSLLTTSSRIAVAVAVVGMVSVGWLSASRASHSAVDYAAAAISPNVLLVQLPRVQVVANRETATQVANNN